MKFNQIEKIFFNDKAIEMKDNLDEQLEKKISSTS